MLLKDNNEVKKFSLMHENQNDNKLLKEKLKSAPYNDSHKKRTSLIKTKTLGEPELLTPVKPHTLIYVKNLLNSENGSPFLPSDNNQMIKIIESPQNEIMSRSLKPSDDIQMINSPYYSKNQQNEEQIKNIKNMKTKEKSDRTPKDGPKQYNTRIIKSKRCDVDTLEYVLRTKFSNSHKTNMEEYIKKVGLSENTKVFCCNTQDEHMRRALLNFGWYENKNINSFFFDLKWVYMDNENDYKFLIDGQFYNHFQNNKELTTKIGLTNNLKDFCEYGIYFDQFYPRCYDLGNNKDMIEFTADYEHTNMMILLKKHIKYFKMKRKEIIKEINKELIIKEEKQKVKNQKEIMIKMIRRKPKNIFKACSYNEDTKKKDFLVNIHLIHIAICYFKTLYRQIKNYIDEGKHYDLSTIDKKFKLELMNYSKTSPPYEVVFDTEKVHYYYFL